MKKIFIFFCFLGSGIVQSFSQDLIVIYPDDSINVKIDKILSDRIIYIDGSSKKTMASRNIKNFQKDFYLEPTKQKKINSIDKTVFHGGGGFSWSYRLAAIPENANSFEQEYYNDIKSGHSYGISIGLFASEFLALGITANRHRSTVAYNNLTFVYSSSPGNYTYIIGNLRDNITIDYFGPTVFFKFSNYSQTLNFLLSGSIGFNTYRNVGMAPFLINGNPEMSNFVIEGSSIGAGTSFSADVKISKYLFVGPQVGIYSGTITRFSLTNKSGTTVIEAPTPESGESLLRINLGGNLRFYF